MAGDSRMHDATRQTTELCVLVVDDDSASLDSLKLLLQRCRYDVNTVSNASRALELVMENKGKFDCVIADTDMPSMDGFQLLESLGKLLPVILLLADEDLIERAYAKGACHCFVKPVRFEDLKDIPHYIIQWKQPCVYSAQENHDNISLHSEDNYERPASIDQNGTPERKRENANIGEAREDGKDDEYYVDPVPQKKPRLVWDDRLKKKFQDVVERLGPDKATPKVILRLMNEPGLTRENIASHLQKYRIFLKREEAKRLQQAVATMSVNAPPTMDAGEGRRQLTIGQNHSQGLIRMPLMQHEMIDGGGPGGRLPTMNMYPGITSNDVGDHLVYPQNSRSFRPEPMQNSHPLMSAARPTLSNEVYLQQLMIDNEFESTDLSGMSYDTPFANSNFAQMQGQAPSQEVLTSMQHENNMIEPPLRQMRDLVPSQQTELDMVVQSGLAGCDPPPPLRSPPITPGTELPLRQELQREPVPNDATRLNGGFYPPNNNIGHSNDSLINDGLEQGDIYLDGFYDFPPYEGLGFENTFPGENHFAPRHP